ncbi:hypothetical protein GCM10008922_01170 [Faecalicatena contorta]|nr:hypothetical protein CE91St64_02860 [Faecalicatena contorta]
MEAACVSEYGDPSEEAVVHQEGKQGLAETGGFEPGDDQKEVHGYAAQLKWEVPPLIDAVIETEGEIPLFPELTGRHKEAADKEKVIQFLGDGNLSFHVGLLLY